MASGEWVMSRQELVLPTGIALFGLIDSTFIAVLLDIPYGREIGVFLGIPVVLYVIVPRFYRAMRLQYYGVELTNDPVPDGRVKWAILIGLFLLFFVLVIPATAEPVPRE